MLITDSFRQDLVVHSNELNGWKEYDYTYLISMKRYLKQQLLTKFPNIPGMKFMIDRPIALRKQIPLMMAIWELGGITVVNDLHYSLQKNPKYQDFYASIDACLVEYQDIELNHVDEFLQVFSNTNRLHELNYFDLDPIFGTIVDDPILATDNDIALLVATSGTTRAPQQVGYTHQQVIEAMQSNIKTYGYSSDEHILHLKSFHHGGLCVNYFLPTLAVCQHHYFMIPDEPLDNLIVTIASEYPINRVMIPWAISEQLIDRLATTKCINALTIQTTHAVKSVEQVDSLFATQQVNRFMILFGCRELPAIFFIQDLTPDSWKTVRDNWDPIVFELPNNKFWDLKVFDDGLGVKASYMEDYYVPGDVFVQLDETHWKWQGRNTQIKRDGYVVNPDTVQLLLKQHFPEIDCLVVADYQYKKLYAFVFNCADNLLDKFNSTIETHIDGYHRLDLVMPLEEKDMVGYKDTTLSVLNFLARKQLNLN